VKDLIDVLMVLFLFVVIILALLAIPVVAGLL
jgi:hypothetical protein